MWTCKKCGEQIEDQFDSCWKCSGAANEVEKTKLPPVKWSDYLLAAIMSYTLPWSVIILNYLMRPNSRTILYQICDKTGKAEIWIAMLVPAALTFLVLIPFLRNRVACWIVYVLAGIVWLTLI
jgi:hypothetical protein